MKNLFLILSLCCCLPALALAEDITYPGYDLTGNDLIPQQGSSGNTVTVMDNKSGETLTNVYGGKGKDGGAGERGGDGNHNSVTIHNGTIEGEVYGGTGGIGGIGGDGNHNSVTIHNGTIKGSVYGGSGGLGESGGSGGAGGDAYHNTVTIHNGTIKDLVFGGRGGTGGTGGTGGIGGTGGDGNHNSVIIHNGIIEKSVYGGYGGDGGNGGSGGTGGDGNHNSVTIHNGTIKGSVYGGSGGLGESGGSGGTGGDSGAANHNSVTIYGGTIKVNVIGGSGGYGGSGGSGGAGGAANYNSVTIHDGTVEGSVYGGKGGWGGGGGLGGDGNHNSVTIYGGTIRGTVYGGYGGAGGSGGAGDAIYNTVTLSGSPVFGTTSKVLGGDGFAGGNFFTGNTLNIWNYSGTSELGDVKNFENYNFILPASLSSGGTLFKATYVTFGSGSERSTLTGLAMAGGGTPPSAGDTFILIEGAISGELTNEVNGDRQAFAMQGKKGVSLLYDFEVQKHSGKLTARIASVQTNPQTKALSEGRAAGMAFVNQGADLIAGQGLQSALAATQGKPMAGFGAISGGKSRYKTGSHVDVEGFSLMTGLAWNNESDWGKLLLGAFFEAGWANYDSHNAFSGYASVKGEGDNEYYGGGVLGRVDFNDLGPGHIYTEASLRAGRTKTDFSSGDLRDPVTGAKGNYDSSSVYYGAHLGLGYVWDITDASHLDMYTNYFWTHQEGDSVSVAGDPIRFQSSDSHRWRTGARFDHSVLSESGFEFTPYIGAAYEYEFDGKAKARVYGRSIDAPELKGGTGIGELGLRFKPSAVSPVSLDLGVQGYSGIREGVSGNFNFKVEF